MFTHCLGMRMQQLRLSRQLLGRGGIGNLARLLVFSRIDISFKKEIK